MFELCPDFNCTFDFDSRTSSSRSPSSPTSSPGRSSSSSRAGESLVPGAMSPLTDKSRLTLGRCNSNPAGVTPRCYPHLKSRFAGQSTRGMSHSTEEPDENLTLGAQSPTRLDDSLEGEPQAKNESSLLAGAEARLPYLTSVLARTASRDSAGPSSRCHSSPSTPFGYSFSSPFAPSPAASENGDAEGTEDAEEEDSEGKETNLFASVLDDLASLAPLEKMIPSAVSLTFPRTSFLHERSPSLDSAAWLSSVSECLCPAAAWSISKGKSKGE